MAVATIDGQFYPTPEELLGQILADLRFACAKVGIVANVAEGSDHYMRAKAFAARASIAIANGRIALADLNPLTATGDALTELAGVFGVFKRAATKASGAIVIGVTGAGTVTIPQGWRWTGPNGQKYEALAITTTGNLGKVDVIAVTAGTASNLDAGAQGQWNLASIGNLKAAVTVDVGGIDGGEPEDDEERLRARLIRRLSFPGVGGSWSQIAQWAEESSAAIDAAFVYTVRGPASYDVALLGATGDRVLSSAIQASAAGYIRARMPGHADLNVTSVNPYLLDVVVDLKLPLPAISGGAGGGWRDSVPWPSSADGVLCKVTAASGNDITVNATSADPPAAGHHFGIWDPAAGRMKEFLVASVAGGSGAYILTINALLSDSPAFVTSGMYVSAGAVSLASYAEELDGHVSGLGPGEKTASPDILPAGRRLPAPEELWPTALTNALLGKLSQAHPEITDHAYAARYATGTTTTVTDAPVTTTSADAPRLLALRHLAFRRAV